jgi:hypothetical protein
MPDKWKPSMVRQTASRNMIPVRCFSCGAPDDRDPAHAAGCPKVEPLSKDELLAVALSVEAGWAGKQARAAGA